MPTPCMDCVRFHYGHCYEYVKQCYCCGGFGHLDRYCPNRGNTIRCVRGEPLAGTRQWCEWHDLDKYPELMRKVLQALKTSPDRAIFVNGVMIYRGTERHFGGGLELPRGRFMEEPRHRRSRSMSPGRRRLTPSPPCQAEAEQRYRGREQAKYRERSPMRARRDAPRRDRHAVCPLDIAYRRAPSPRFKDGPSVKTFEVPQENAFDDAYSSRVNLHLNKAGQENRVLGSSGFYGPQSSVYLEGQALVLRADNNSAASGKIDEDLKSPIPIEVFEGSGGQAPRTKPPRHRPTEHVEDPHFVLGVARGAGRYEILEAYQQRIAEIQRERFLDSAWHLVGPKNVFERSIRMVNSAKQQLLGY